MSTSSSSIQRPVVLLDMYSGEGSWSECKYYFENVALVNERSEERNCSGYEFVWLAERRKQFSTWQPMQQHPSAPPSKHSMKDLSQRVEGYYTRWNFRPEGRRNWKGGQSLQTNLKTLVEKGFPELQNDAKEQLTFQNYLCQLGPPQVAFSVKQKQPKNVDKAVGATIEMESYLSPTETIGAAQCACGQEDTDSIKKKMATIALCLWHWYHKTCGTDGATPPMSREIGTKQWTAECQTAFEELRQNLISKPVLAHPDFSQRFILDTNASNTGLGAVLSQVDSNGQEHIIAYGSRLLSKAERR